MPRADIVIPFAPEENRNEFDRLFTEMNAITVQFNSIMGRIEQIRPDENNYLNCRNALQELTPEIHTFCQRVLRWSNDFQAYELNLTYDCSRSQSDNFLFLGFKVMISNFVRNSQRQSDTVIRSVNDTWNSIQMQESLVLTASLVGKVTHFAKNHPVFFTIELIVHIAVIIVGLKELHWI